MSEVLERRLITIFESVMMLKHHMKEFMVPPPTGYQRPWLHGKGEYPTQRFMEALLRILFRTNPDENRFVDYDLTNAETILIYDGMAADKVKMVASSIFEQLVDVVADNIPHLSFGHDYVVNYTFTNEFDVLISMELPKPTHRQKRASF